MAEQQRETGWRLAKDSPALIMVARAVFLAVVIVVIILLTNSHQKTVAHPYALTPPAGWSRVRPPAGASSAFQDPAPDNGVTGKVRPLISVLSQPLDTSEAKMSFSQVEQLYLKGIAANFLNYQQLALTQTTISKRPAILVTYSFTQDNEPLTAQTLFMTKYGNSYIVTGQSLTSTWQTHAADIQKSLLTFRT